LYWITIPVTNTFCLFFLFCLSLFHGAYSFDAITTNQEFDDAITAWRTDSVAAALVYGPISDWDVSSVTDMNGAFSGASDFNEDISAWDVSNVINMSYMFHEAFDFNQDISAWNVGSATDMYGMFRRASSFDQDINTWNVTSVTDMTEMF